MEPLDRPGAPTLKAVDRSKLLDAQKESPPFLYQLKDTELCLGYDMDSVELSEQLQ